MDGFPMHQCPQCGKTYSEEYQFCPVDGASLRASQSGKGRRPARPPAQIRVRTLMLGIFILILCGGIAFTSAFLYQYWKPKYGGLTIKTTPPEALITIDGKTMGVSPLSLPNLLSGGHQLRITKEGYKDFSQQVAVIPYAFESVYRNLEPVVPQLSNEQLAEIESWRKKLDSALKENILLPPPDEYNVLYFAGKILAIDPANKYATDVKTRAAESLRQIAESAYAREDWLESEKQYKNLALLFPNDITVSERLNDIAAKIESGTQNRDTLIQDFKARAETALKAGNLTPPDKDNALDAIRNIQRLDKNNPFAQETISHIKDLLQNRGDAKIAASDWSGARNEFRQLLQYFPEDLYGKGRLASVEAKLAESGHPEARSNEELPPRQKAAALRQSALASFRSGVYPKSIADWQEYLKLEPVSDEAFFYIGAAYQNQKQLDTAILNFEKCLLMNPNNTLAHLNLGLLYDYHRKNFKQAEDHLLKAKELGGAEKYSPDKLQAMIQDLRDRAHANAVLKLSFPVEHKHAFSSCRGSLYFTEEGMEFRTEQIDHSFYETYKQMRGFAIDGIVLTIKTRQNNKFTFNFINPGDAEKIRAWHSTHGLGDGPR
jgi:tetratricopeptide (TPR) repeat protein